MAHIQSVGASLVIWIVAALLAWTGAGSFAELGASLPRNGGAQAYLAYTYGPLASYLFTWTTVFLISPGKFSPPTIYYSVEFITCKKKTLFWLSHHPPFSGTKALNGLVFAEYLNRVLWNATRGDDAPSEVIPRWVINTTAVAAVVLVFLLVVGARSLGPHASNVLTSVKVCV